MKSQATLRRLSENELCLVSGGEDEIAEIVCTGRQLLADNRLSDNIWSSIGGFFGFTSESKNFGCFLNISWPDTDGDGIADNLDPDPDVVDIVVTVTAQQVSAMKMAYARAETEVSVALATGQIAAAGLSTKLKITGAMTLEGMVQIAEADKPNLVAERAMQLYQNDGHDGQYDGESEGDRLMANGWYRALGLVVH